jgi:hypothetical protein
MEYVSRCPACSSLVRRDQDWCTLCHADLRPPELRPAASTEPVEHAEGSVDPLSAPLNLLLADRQEAAPAPAPETVPGTAPVTGKHARLEPPAVAEPGAGEPPAGAVPAPSDEAELDLLIARLAAETQDPIGGIVSRLPETQTMRVVLALAVGLGVALVLIVASWIIGLVVG